LPAVDDREVRAIPPELNSYGLGLDGRPVGEPASVISGAVDVSAQVGAKRAALATYVSQPIYTGSYLGPSAPGSSRLFADEW